MRQYVVLALALPLRRLLPGLFLAFFAAAALLVAPVSLKAAPKAAFAPQIEGVIRCRD